MSTVVSFPVRPHVVISSELITETRHHSAAGVDVIRHDPPRRRFFLDLVEADGACGVWDGDSYVAALAAAREWAADGVAIRDRTAETWGRA